MGRGLTTRRFTYSTSMSSQPISIMAPQVPPPVHCSALKYSYHTLLGSHVDTALEFLRLHMYNAHGQFNPTPRLGMMGTNEEGPATGPRGNLPKLGEEGSNLGPRYSPSPKHQHTSISSKARTNFNVVKLPTAPIFSNRVLNSQRLSPAGRGGASPSLRRHIFNTRHGICAFAH